MAAGDLLIDSDGDLVLDSAGNLAIHDGVTDTCCCSTTPPPDPTPCTDCNPGSGGNVTVSGTPIHANHSDPHWTPCGCCHDSDAVFSFLGFGTGISHAGNAACKWTYGFTDDVSPYTCGLVTVLYDLVTGQYEVYFGDSAILDSGYQKYNAALDCVGGRIVGTVILSLSGAPGCTGPDCAGSTITLVFS